MRHLSCCAALWIVTNAAAADPFPCGCPDVPAPHKTFYCDPVNGSAKGDGSKELPFGRLQDTLKQINGVDDSKGLIHAGDRLILMSGNHGTINLYGSQFKNSNFIAIESADGHVPVLDKLIINQVSRWSFKGITVKQPGIPKTRIALVTVLNSTDVRFEDLDLASLSREAVLNWEPTDFATQSATYGIYVNRASRVSITNCKIFGVQYGIALTGDAIRVEANSIDYFWTDGIDITSCQTVIRGNRITNRWGLAPDGFHHDGIQGFTAYDEQFTRDVIIDANVVIASTGVYPQVPPVPTGIGEDYMQGISVFDGVWSNIVVTGNVVAASANHGMSFYGLTDSRIENNTVVKLCSSESMKTVLGLFVAKPKWGSVSPSNVQVRNNIANLISIPPAVVPQIQLEGNLQFLPTNVPGLKTIPVVSPQKVFRDFDPLRGRYDLRLRVDSPAIGVGTRTVVKTVEVPVDAGAIPFE